MSWVHYTDTHACTSTCVLHESACVRNNFFLKKSLLKPQLVVYWGNVNKSLIPPYWVCRIFSEHAGTTKRTTLHGKLLSQASAHKETDPLYVENCCLKRTHTRKLIFSHPRDKDKQYKTLLKQTQWQKVPEKIYRLARWLSSPRSLSRASWPGFGSRDWIGEEKQVPWAGLWAPHMLYPTAYPLHTYMHTQENRKIHFRLSGK